MYRCMYCDQRVRFDNRRGWVHPEGGAYMVKCKDCGWHGAPYPSPITCPECGSENVVDDHCVRPVKETQQ